MNPAPFLRRFFEALSLKYPATRAQILAGDNKLAIEEAERKLDKLVAKASKLLEPLGVTQQELRLLVRDRLAKPPESGRTSATH